MTSQIELIFKDQKLREKFLLLEILMLDICMNWSDKPQSDNRVLKSIEIAKQLWQATNYQDNRFKKVICTIGIYSTGIYEGRYLRMSFSRYGGYENMSNYHQLKLSKNRRTRWFKNQIKKYVIADYKWED